jgi:hypothetical protein
MKALLASALSWADSCLSFSVTSLGSVKLSVDNAGDGTTEEGGVEERDEGCEDSLMLTINGRLITPSHRHLSGACLSLFVPQAHTQSQKITVQIVLPITE